MGIRIVKENLLNAHVDLIAHGVNSKGKFASGIAGQIRSRWTHVYNDYMSKYKTEGWHLGDVQFVLLNDPVCHARYIVNCCTQKAYGYDNTRYVDYNAIEKCLNQVFRFAQREKYTIGMPKIGCGLGGGSWAQVYSIIYKLSLLYPPVDIEVYEL